MSNLIKTAYFNVTGSEKRVIDSDSHVEDYIPNIYAQEDVKSSVQFPVFSEEEASGDGLEASFQAGMNVINMDEVMDQERKLLSEELSRQGEEILENARNEAQQILAEAQEGAQQIHDQAYEEGKNEGLEEGRSIAEKELEEQRRQLEEDVQVRLQELEEQEKHLEVQFADIMVQLIGKVTGILCEDKKDIIIYLIDQALHNLEKTKQITLRVSREDIGSVSMQRAVWIKGLPEGVEFDVMEDNSLTKDQCIIETDNKIIDCSLDAQLSSLGEQIKLLAM